jgi:hypothetical protein
MQERSGSRRSASLKEWRKILNEFVAGERAAILELIERTLKSLAEGQPYSYNTGCRDTSKALAAAIRARGEQP